MKRRQYLAVIMLGLLAFATTVPALAEPAVAKKNKSQHDTRMEWWREAKFGMFIHWGVYSVPAGFYHGKPVRGLGEWIMHNARIPMAEYQQFAKRFDPTDFNRWVKIAKDAGMKYIVITTKHHDGFAMWPPRSVNGTFMTRRRGITTL